MTLLEVLAFAFKAMGEIAAAALDAHEGKITPDEALERMTAARKATADVDARVDAALADKFRDEGGK